MKIAIVGNGLDGGKDGVEAVTRAVLEKRDVSAVKLDLPADDFDFGKL